LQHIGPAGDHVDDILVVALQYATCASSNVGRDQHGTTSENGGAKAYPRAMGGPAHPCLPGNARIRSRSRFQPHELRRPTRRQRSCKESVASRSTGWRLLHTRKLGQRRTYTRCGVPYLVSRRSSSYSSRPHRGILYGLIDPRFAMSEPTPRTAREAGRSSIWRPRRCPPMAIGADSQSTRGLELKGSAAVA